MPDPIVISVAVLVNVIPLPGIRDFNEKLGFVDDADNSELPEPVETSEMSLAGDAFVNVTSVPDETKLKPVPASRPFNSDVDVKRLVAVPTLLIEVEGAFWSVVIAAVFIDVVFAFVLAVMFAVFVDVVFCIVVIAFVLVVIFAAFVLVVFCSVVIAFVLVVILAAFVVIFAVFVDVVFCSVVIAFVLVVILAAFVEVKFWRVVIAFVFVVIFEVCTDVVV